VPGALFSFRSHHHGGGNLGSIAQLHAIASWPHAPWIEVLHDPPIAAYTNGFAIMGESPHRRLPKFAN
jgi:hypothetical protein